MVELLACFQPMLTDLDLAVFPEMRTALRTYHPVPSLQKTDGNLQDAPRIKNILKSCLLPTELQDTPMTPADILARSRSGEVPPTTIVNLIFIIASHAAAISQAHFPAQIHFDVLDFFSPINISSESRARAFLWLLYHYHEAPSRNPFDDEASRKRPGIIPTLETLSDEEAKLENVDTPEEIEWGRKMTEQRRVFLATKDSVLDDDDPGTKSSRPTRDPSPSESVASIAPEERFERVSRGPFTQQAVRLPPILPPLPSPPLPHLKRGYHDTFFHPTRTPAELYPQHYPPDIPPFHVTDDKYLDDADPHGRGLTLPPLHYIESYDGHTSPRTLPPLSIPPLPPLHAGDTPPTFSMPPDIEMNSPTIPRTRGIQRSMLERKWIRETRLYLADMKPLFYRSMARRETLRSSRRIGRRARREHQAGFM
ncbi:hypothetical protein EIP86_000843 [Pleurotus ostreatoroseus]|nr:hypothetical protein EIP86_000843 [Pleurotus ostreatoroseus]